jgi:hypothetical protein
MRDALLVVRIQRPELAIDLARDYALYKPELSYIPTIAYVVTAEILWPNHWEARR